MEHIALPRFEFKEAVAELANSLRGFFESLEPTFEGDPLQLLHPATRPKSIADLSANHLVREPMVVDLSVLYGYGLLGEYLREPLDHLEGVVHFLEDTLKSFPAPLCLSIVRASVARWAVDTGESSLDIEQVALLAGMDEKSVRNACNPKSRDPLPTYTEGNRTYISAEAARNWLSRRKNFIPTQGKPDDSRAVPAAGFVSVADVHQFVEKRMKAMELTPSAINRLLKKHRLSPENFAVVASGDLNLSPIDLARVATILEVDQTSFVTSIVKTVLKSIA